MSSHKPWDVFAVIDKRVVTEANPASARKKAEDVD